MSHFVPGSVLERQASTLLLFASCSGLRFSSVLVPVLLLLCAGHSGCLSSCSSQGLSFFLSPLSDYGSSLLRRFLVCPERVPNRHLQSLSSQLWSPVTNPGKVNPGSSLLLQSTSGPVPSYVYAGSGICFRDPDVENPQSFQMNKSHDLMCHCQEFKEIRKF